MGIAMLPEERLLHCHCPKHKCELVEGEHYDDWFLAPDFSGFHCPEMIKLADALEEKYAPRFPPLEEELAIGCTGKWMVSPRGHDDIDVFGMIADAIKKKEDK